MPASNIKGFCDVGQMRRGYAAIVVDAACEVCGITIDEFLNAKGSEINGEALGLTPHNGKAILRARHLVAAWLRHCAMDSSPSLTEIARVLGYTTHSRVHVWLRGFYELPSSEQLELLSAIQHEVHARVYRD